MKQLAKEWQPLHKIVLLYVFISAVIFFTTPYSSSDFVRILWPRLLVIVYLGMIPFITKKMGHIASLIDLFWAIGLLGILYSETAIINQSFNGWDQPLIMADQWLTGTQPSLIFSSTVSHKLVADVFYLGYFSYYFMTLVVAIMLYLKCRPHFNRLFFMVITSFLLYYLTFSLFKTIGPQFYFPSPQNQAPQGYIFARAVKMVQELGEVPTGAFPSSHIGMTTIYLFITYKYYRPLFWILLPFAALLFPATVYIKAHYLVDVFGGIVSAFVCMWSSSKLWKLFTPDNQLTYDPNY